MTSSRRVKKGPGRRPQSAKRQRFMELRARGWSVRAAAREVGVSRSAATNWARGYTTYRNGVVVGFVPPLDPLAVRQISPRYLSEDERIKIADLRRSGLSMRAIAGELGWASPFDDFARVAPQHGGQIRVPALRGSSARHCASSTSSPTSARDQCRPQRRGHRTARSPVGPAADQPAPSSALSRRSVDAVVS